MFQKSPLRFVLSAGLLLACACAAGFWLRPHLAGLGAGRSVAQVVADLTAKGVGRDLGVAPGEVDAVLLVAVKKTRVLELWARKPGEGFVTLRTYPFPAYSGGIGPKLREGDRQIPEGIYGLEYLNPNSSYHLSIKVGYPNAFERERGREDGRARLGGDIFIHGKAVTIGCIPIGDAAIEELFWFVAKAGPKRTKVIIMPVDFRDGAPAPEVDGIAWETELYDAIREELRRVFGEREAVGR